jgi:hypothetical protein
LDQLEGRLVTDQPEERVGTPADFARLFGEAQAAQAEPAPDQEEQEGSRSQPVSQDGVREPEPSLPGTPPSLEDLRHEAGIRAGLPADLTYAVQGDDWQAISASAAQLGEIWAKHTRPAHPPVDFDGGARVPASGVSNGHAAHNELIIDLIRNQRSDW